MSTPPSDDAHRLGLPLPQERIDEVRVAFEPIRAAIEALRAFDVGDAHPAVVFRPIGTDRDRTGR